MAGAHPASIDFAYPAAGTGSMVAEIAAGAAAIALYADRPRILLQWREEALIAGFRVGAAATLGSLADGASPLPPADVVIADCPAPCAASLAALSRLDMQARQARSQLVVSTSAAGLEDVFSCLDQSAPQILVDPTEADFALALGRARIFLPASRVRELADEDRLHLLRLTEQVGQLAARLGETPVDRAGFDEGFDGRGRVASPGLAFHGAAASAAAPIAPRSRPPLPDPRLIRRILRQRQQRSRYFPGELFADPAWDMLLDLTAARAEHQRVSVTSLCIASGVPPTTALRWIGQMTHAGLLERVEDTSDRRRAFIALSDMAAEGMAHYFAALGNPGPFPL